MWIYVGYYMSTKRRFVVVSAHPPDPRLPGRLHDRSLTLSGCNQSILTIVYASIPPQALPVHFWRYGPCADPGHGQLLAVWCPQTSQTSDYLSAKLLLWVLSEPVLKHGPSSLSCARVIGMHKPKCEMNVIVGLPADRGSMGHVTMRPRTPRASHHQFSLREEAHLERTRWYPKDGELCLVRTKSGETPQEFRSDSDVQIDRRN